MYGRDELERPEETGAAQVANDRQLEQLGELAKEHRLLLADVLDDLLALHDLDCS